MARLLVGGHCTTVTTICFGMLASLMIVGLAGIVATASPVTTSGCAASDSNLQLLQDTVCSSFAQSYTWWCGYAWKNVTANEDWPMQASYVGNLLSALLAPSTCLNTSTAASVVSWLNGPMANASVLGSFMWTYTNFQMQYYDMPRKQGERIESAWTLGMKCWAFAYLSSIWQPSALEAAVTAVNLTLAYFIEQYNCAIPPTLLVCNEVLANCFVNESYNPSRNGTCPLDVDMFVGGFEWENVRVGHFVKYPFHPM